MKELALGTWWREDGGGDKSGHGGNGSEANPVVQVLWPWGGSSSDKKKRMKLRPILKVDSMRPVGLDVRGDGEEGGHW